MSTTEAHAGDHQDDFDGTKPPEVFLATEPPPFAVRAASLLVVAIVLSAFLVAMWVELPETVGCPFVVAAASASASAVAPRNGVIETVAIRDGLAVGQGQVLFRLLAAEPCCESPATQADAGPPDGGVPGPRLIEVRANRAGVVSRVAARVGDAVTRGQTLCRFDQETAALEAVLAVPEENLADVLPGQPVNLLFQAFPYGRYGVKQGRVTAVDTTLTDHTFHVRASLADVVIRTPQRTLAVQPGMSGEARIHIGRRTIVTSIFEPLNALRETTMVPAAADDAAPPDP
jgi:multidrug efflux pump subunit AcrA (membrane-fusion protein)